MKKFAISCIITLLVVASFVVIGSLFTTSGIYILLFVFAFLSLLFLSAMLYIELLLKACYKDLFNSNNKNIIRMKKTRLSFLLSCTEKVELSYIYAINDMFNEVSLDYLFYLSIPYNSVKKKSEALLLIYLKLLIYVFDGDMDGFKEEERNVSKIFEALPPFISLHFQIGEYLILKKNKRNTDIIEEDLRKTISNDDEKYDVITENLKKYIIKKEGESLPPLFKNILA